MSYQPKTGAKCSCKRGVQRDNCPNCEGTGMVIDFAAIRRRRSECDSCQTEEDNGLPLHAIDCPRLAEKCADPGEWSADL